MLSFKFINLAILSVGLYTALAKGAAIANTKLHACPSYISKPPTTLVSEKKVGSYFQCDYLREVSAGSFAGSYCFYHLNLTLTHYPNTPLRADSSPDCPKTMPLASSYLIKASDAQPGKCVTAASLTNGAKVEIEDCDNKHGNPNQIWSFQGSQIRIGKFCLDVKDGNTANGAKLQLWTCSANNKNQQFMHSGGNVLDIPIDRISWSAHPNKCVDLTNGSKKNGNQIQMWTCGSNNPNQGWTIAIP